jgi:chlorophyllide a reductase subunit Y
LNAALKNADRFAEMKTFFAGVGEGYAAGVCQDTPKDRPEFKAKRRKAAAVKPAEEMGSC